MCAKSKEPGFVDQRAILLWLDNSKVSDLPVPPMIAKSLASGQEIEPARDPHEILKHFKPPQMMYYSSSIVEHQVNHDRGLAFPWKYRQVADF